MINEEIKPLNSNSTRPRSIKCNDIEFSVIGRSGKVHVRLRNERCNLFFKTKDLRKAALFFDQAANWFETTPHAFIDKFLEEHQELMDKLSESGD